jgi:outer membrane protein assembly factor BamB
MRRLAIALTVPAVIAAAVPTGNAAPHPRVHAARNITGLSTWATYHRTTHRSGVARANFVAPLHSTWSTALDGAVYGEPLIVHGWLLAATEKDSVYQLDPGTGKVRWRTHLGRPASEANIRNDQPGCGDIFPLGITGTPAYDAKTGSVFVVAETHGGHHTLWALNAATGTPRWHTTTDVVKHRDRLAEQQRSALLVSHGRVYTQYGGLSGDCGDYVGYITSTSVTGKGKTYHYAVPTKREAGMWSPGGAVVGPNGRIYVASGNGAEQYGKWDKSDSVAELTPKKLHRVGVFAPSVWKADNRADLDLGSATPVPVAGRIVIAGKRGTVYLLKPSLGGIGSQLDTLHGCPAYGGAAHVGNLVVMPCHDGIRALVVHHNRMRWKWRVDGSYGSPIIAGHKVLLAHDPTGGFPGLLSLISLRSGRVVSNTITGPQTHFPSAIAVGNHAFVGTTKGVSAVRGS